MKLRLRKTLRRSRVKRKTRRQKGGNNLIVKYNGVLVKGQQLKKSETVSAPSVKFSKTGKLYTLIMWDPDVPSQSQPAFLHWLVINIQSPNDIQNNQVLEYKGPEPPSGTHRYYFGLYEQQRQIAPNQPERSNFNIKQFINENNLINPSEVFMKVAFKET